MKQIFQNNGYLEKLVQKTINSVKDGVKQIRAIQLHKSYLDLEGNYNTVKLFMHFISTSLGTSQLKEKLPCSTTSFCAYSFI